MKRKELFIVVFGAILFAFSLNRIFPENAINQVIISPLAEKFTNVSELTDNKNGQELARLVEKSLTNSEGNYGVVIKNLRTGEIYTRNENREFESASLYKLWTMAAAFNLIEKEQLSEADTISRNISELNRIFDINPGDAEQTTGTISRTVAEAIDQMITVSHNYSALLLAAEIGNSTIATYMRELGLSNSKIGQPPTTTPADIAKFYEILYNGKIISQAKSAQMIEILERQELNDRIPKYLPDNIRVAHKTGELGAFKHDAGIIFASDTILFVILTETSSQEIAAEKIAELARDVFNYFENK